MHNYSVFLPYAVALLLSSSRSCVSSFHTGVQHHRLFHTTTTTPPPPPSSSALHLAKSRRAKRSRKADRSRPQQFYDAIKDAQGKSDGDGGGKDPDGDDDASSGGKSSAIATKPPPPATDISDDQDDKARKARVEEAQRRMEERPDVSTIIVDEETGIEMVAQGKAVLDVVTRRAVKLSDLGPMYRLAQMFPGVPPDVRDRHRYADWTTIEVPEMVEKLREACMVKMKDGIRDIPPHPSVANKAIDFVLANRDRLGSRMKRTLGRLYLHSLSEGNKEEAIGYQKLWKNFLTLENHISAPFRQIIMDGEGRVGPNFGNLDLKSYCGGEVYERCADYLVLKGMVAHWEKKVVDADYLEKTPRNEENYMTILCRGDPKRFLPDPPILFTLRECTQVCLMAQQMTKAFVETPELFDDLPPEVRFLEAALSIRGGAPLRKYIVDEFCPAEGITPEALREGMRRLLAQFENMQVDPYGDIANLIERLCVAMSLGTDDERDPYVTYLISKDQNAGPAAFQTYTFDADPQSHVRFLDSQYESSGVKADVPRGAPIGGGVDFFEGADFFNFGGGSPAQSPSATQEQQRRASNQQAYKVPQARAAGRPHELGWLELLEEQNEQEKLEDQKRFGKVPPGQILLEDD